MEQQVHPKRWNPSIELHDVTLKKTVIFILADLRGSNFTTLLHYVIYETRNVFMKYLYISYQVFVLYDTKLFATNLNVEYLPAFDKVF